MCRSPAWSLLLLLAALPARAADGWFPFVLPFDDDSLTITSVAALNPAAAGASGFLRSQGGHLVDGTGRRVRLLGVNLVFAANFPHKGDAARVAARLRKFGVNVVRLHHMDYYRAPQGIFDPRFKDTRHLDPGQLDRLDHLVGQLKKHGIYINVNLHVSRAFNAADGLKETDRLPARGKVAVYFHPRLIELQKEYARALLDRVNPYTKIRYTAEPAVAVVELTNEDTLLGAAWDGTLERLPATYRGELVRQWNAWLKKKYAGTAGLRKAWKATAQPGPGLLGNGTFSAGTKGWQLEQHAGARASMAVVEGMKPPAGVAGRVLRVTVDRPGKESWHVQLTRPRLDLADGAVYTLSFQGRADQPRTIAVSAGLDQDDWHEVGLSRTVRVNKGWKPFRLVFTAKRTRPGHCRVVFALGQAAGRIELAGVRLERGAAGALPAGSSLEDASVPLGQPSSAPAGRDWIAFLMDTEKRYLSTMRDYLKKELKLGSCVVCSQASYGGLGGLAREARADFTDMHAYWEHPHFPRRPWDPVDWLIRNTAMVRDRGTGTLAGLARYRLADRAFTVSEYNHPAPNDYQAECVPLLAAFAAWQDWDGIYLFDYNGNRDDWGSERIRNFFSIDSNPAKMALLPAAALLFRRGDLPPAPDQVELQVPAAGVADLLARHGPGAGSVWEAAGSPRKDALTARLTVRLTDGRGEPRLRRRGGKADGPKALSWQGAGTDKALVRVDSSASKLAVGFVGGRKVELTGWSIEVPGDAPRFAALVLSPKDGRPAERSRSLLLTAVGRVENAGMTWNRERTSLGRGWGKGPVRAEGVVATIALKTQARRVSVHALDTRGKRQGQVEVRLKDAQATFRIGPVHRTLWYEIEAEQ